jgi:2-dehydropantoate 2-reductase
LQQSVSPNRLRFLCFGVGAIGTYLGGSLILAGHEVVFTERPAVADEVRSTGLTLDLGPAGGVQRVDHPQVVASIEDALAMGSFDAALLAIKAYDTQALVNSLIAHRMALPPIISFQNGVDNEPLLAKELGAERVIAGTVTTAIGRKGAGNIVVERLRGIGVALDHPLGPSLQAVMDGAGLNARGYPNAAAMKWSKMLTNLLANASSAILDLPPAEIYAHPGLFRMEIQQLREALRVMAALKIPVVDLPATPVRLLAFISANLPPVLSRPLLSRALGSGRGSKMPSFHIDLHGGRGKSEVDYLNGAVVRHGKKVQVAAPVNATLTRILLALTGGEVPLDAYAHRPEKLLEAIASGSKVEVKS